MNDPLPVYLDPGEFVSVTRLIPAKASLVCQHHQVDFGKPVGGLIEVVCLECSHRWQSIKVWEPPAKVVP